MAPAWPLERRQFVPHPNARSRQMKSIEGGTIPGRLAAAAGLVVVLLGATPACAVHYNRGNFVQAFQPCDPGSANELTSGGIPACVPAVPVSDCDSDPTNA